MIIRFTSEDSADLGRYLLDHMKDHALPEAKPLCAAFREGLKVWEDHLTADPGDVDSVQRAASEWASFEKWVAP